MDEYKTKPVAYSQLTAKNNQSSQDWNHLSEKLYEIHREQKILC